jgi:hypothetical protein
VSDSSPAAIAASVPAFLATRPAGELAGFFGASLAEGAWLAVVPVGIVAAGLVFHGAVVDNAERLHALSQQIAQQVQAVMVQEFGRAVDGLILAGGVV